MTTKAEKKDAHIEMYALLSLSFQHLISIVRHTTQTRRVEIHKSLFHVTLCKCTEVQKVTPVGCDWCISVWNVERWTWKREH